MGSSYDRDGEDEFVRSTERSVSPDGGGGGAGLGLTAKALSRLFCVYSSAHLTSTGYMTHRILDDPIRRL
jgi:hypothetical protein